MRKTFARARTASMGPIAGVSGDEVAWDEAYFGLRQDLYVIRDSVYAAVELYCVTPDCDCGRVNVRFDDIESEETYVGVVTIERSGELGFELDD